MASAEGRFPSSGTPVRVVPPPPHLAGAVVAFSGCTFIAADVDPLEVDSRLGSDPRLFDRWEVAYEISARAPAGTGRALATAALGTVPAGEPLFAQIAPGHARSLRAALAAGYEPIGGEVLITEPR